MMKFRYQFGMRQAAALRRSLLWRYRIYAWYTRLLWAIEARLEKLRG